MVSREHVAGIWKPLFSLDIRGKLCQKAFPSGNSWICFCESWPRLVSWSYWTRLLKSTRDAARSRLVLTLKGYLCSVCSVENWSTEVLMQETLCHYIFCFMIWLMLGKLSTRTEWCCSFDISPIPTQKVRTLDGGWNLYSHRKHISIASG